MQHIRFNQDYDLASHTTHVEFVNFTALGFANKMAPGVSEGVLRAEHESSKTFHHVRFSRKRGLKLLKIAFLAIFEKL